MLILKQVSSLTLQIINTMKTTEQNETKIVLDM